MPEQYIVTVEPLVPSLLTTPHQYLSLDETTDGVTPVNAIERINGWDYTDNNLVRHTLDWPVGAARRFDAALDQSLTRANNATEYNPNTEHTWGIEFRAATGTIGSVTRYLLNKGTGSTDREMALSVTPAGFPQFTLYHSDGTASTFARCTTKVVTEGVIHRIMCGYDKPNAKIWLRYDDEPIVETAYANTPEAAAQTMQIGKFGANTTTRWGGDIGSVGLWLGTISWREYGYWKLYAGNLEALRNYDKMRAAQLLTLGAG